jgi:hypothetical protein
MSTREIGIIAVMLAAGLGCGAQVEDAGGTSGDPLPKPTAPAHPWPMLAQGATHRGRNISGGTTRGPHRSWDLVLDAPVFGSCVIAADGTIYAATEHALDAVSPAGEVRWSTPISLPGDEAPSPAIDAAGRIYVRDGDRLAAFEPSGDRAWSLGLANGILGSPTIGLDGTIYVSQPSGPLLAITPNGVVANSFAPATDARYSTPVVAANGSLTFMQVDTFGSEIWSFEASGRQRFHVTSGGPIYGYQAYPVEGPGGIVYIAPDSGVMAVGSTGAIAWQRPYTSDNFGPAIGADGTVYPSYGNPLLALAPDGTPKWNVDLGWNGFGESVAIAADGTIAWGGDKLYRLDPDGTLVATVDLGSAIVSRLAVDDDGTVIFGTGDGRLHAR